MGSADAAIDARPRTDVGPDSSGDAGPRDGDAGPRDGDTDRSPSVCSRDEDCGELHLCTGGQCIRCHATCVNNADCVAGAVCFFRNYCTYCGAPDASAVER